MGIKSDFIVESNGLCFFCFNRIATSPQIQNASIKQEMELNPSTHTIYSLQCLSRFLKMDLEKVFDEQEAIPPHLLTKVKTSTLKVGLCEGCADLRDNFSQLYRQLEKIRMEVVSSLGNIYDKLTEANHEGKIQKLKNLAMELGPSVSNSKDGWLGKLEILEVLRTEAIKKCKLRIRSTTPRINVQNMTVEEVQSATTTTNVETSQCLSAKISSEVDTSQIQLKHIKEEHPIPNSEWDGEDDSNHYGDAFEADHDAERSSHAKVESDACDLNLSALPTPGIKHATVVTRKSNNIPTNAKSRMNMKQNRDKRRYPCPICSRKFTSPSNLRRHHKSIHLQIKYNCKLCSKQFSQRAYYIEHHNMVHLGRRISCPVCNKYFINKSNLTRHRRVTCFGVGEAPKPKTLVGKCTYCGKGFTDFSNLKRHVKNFHL